MASEKMSATKITRILKLAGLAFCALWAVYALIELIGGKTFHPTLASFLLPLSLGLLIAVNLYGKKAFDLAGASFGAVEYIQIVSPEFSRRICQRYRPEIERLKAIGFDPIFDFGQAFPLLRVLLVFPAAVIIFMWLNHEVMDIQDRAKFVSAHPVFAATDRSALAHTFGLGTKFYTAFEDGTLLVSKSFKDRLPGGEGLVKHGKGGSIEDTWTKHQDRIREMEARGKRIDRQSGFGFYSSLLRRG